MTQHGENSMLNIINLILTTQLAYHTKYVLQNMPKYVFSIIKKQIYNSSRTLS